MGVGVSPVTELAKLIRAPYVQGAVNLNGTSMVKSRCDTLEIVGRSDLVGFVPICGGPITQLPPIVRAPSQGEAVAPQSDAVALPRIYAFDVAVHQLRRVLLAVASGVPDAQLSIIVPTPSPQGRVRLDSQAVPIAGRYSHHII